MTHAHVAIITRTKNRPVLLERALESVLAQTFTDWHHVIVNDGGDPAAVERLCATQRDRYGNRLTIVHHATSRGMEAASNAGMRASSSEYAVIHDDDDSWKPTFLEECVAYLASPKKPWSIAGVVTHSDRIFEELDGETIRTMKIEPYNAWLESITLLRLAADNPFPPISFVFSRAAYESIGPFREDFPVLGDWDFHLRFIARYDIGLIPKALANYHHRPSQSGDYGNTLFDGRRVHKEYDAILRNELLRRDLASGRVGLGLLVALAGAIEQVRLETNALRYLPDGLGRAKQRLKRFASRVRTILGDKPR
jgi:glycosyltransferase involved in cell wall biosynthesis